MYSFTIFNRTIYLNPLNGDVSFNCDAIKDNKYIINREDFLNSYKQKHYTFCLAITNDCNMQCEYCFNKNKTQKNMNIEEAVSCLEFLFKQFNNGEKYFIDLSGFGEPLLNLKCVYAIADFCLKKSDEIKKEVIPMLSTNGLLLTKKIASELQNHKILFGVSIDGNKITNNLFRKLKNNEGSFDIIMRNIESIENKDYLGVSCTLTNHVFNLCESIDYLHKNFKTISFRPVRDISLGINVDCINRWIEEYKKLTSKIIDNAKKGDITILLCLMNGEDLFGNYIYRMIGNFRTLTRCDSSISRFCYVNDDYYCGCAAQINEPNFHFHKVNLKGRQETALKKKVYECSNCIYKFYCGGQCEIETKLYQGYNKTNCIFKQSLIQLAAYIKLTIFEFDHVLYNDLYKFCIEKQNRYHENIELREFIKKHKNMSFTQAKELYDKIKRRY